MAKIIAYERELIQKKAINEELQRKVDELEEGVPLTDLSSSPKAGSSSSPVKTKAQLKSFSPSKRKRLAEISAVHQKSSKLSETTESKAEWAKEEDRILLENIKRGVNTDELQIPNRSKSELKSRIDFLIEFVKKMRK